MSNPFFPNRHLASIIITSGLIFGGATAALAEVRLDNQTATTLANQACQRFNNGHTANENFEATRHDLIAKTGVASDDQANRMTAKLLYISVDTFCPQHSVTLNRFTQPNFQLPDFVTLTAKNADAQIMVRSSPSSNAPDRGYGLVDDRVEALDLVIGQRGYSWYQVRFPKSGTVGWIRGDFIQ